MRLHRVALAAYSATRADAFNGVGGIHAPGRWHSRGHPIVYAAQHVSLAMAESLVHIQRSNHIEPFNRWEIEIPDDRIAASPAALPAGWRHDIPFTRSLG